MVFLSSSLSAFGQEYIRRSYETILCDTSIVRHIGHDSVLVYNKINQTSSFMIVTPSMTTVIPTWYWESIYVNDFEVEGKWVYFCGYQLNGNVKKAIFGRFILSRFGDNMLSYEILDTCTELLKLDHYTYTEEMAPYVIYSEKHLVMIGTTGKRPDVLVDVDLGGLVPGSPMPPILGDALHASTDETEYFDDVAVTDNHVVISTRRKMEGIPIIDFWQFDFPPYAGSCILPFNVTHYCFGSPVAGSKVILEHPQGDEFAAVCKVAGYSKMAMLLVDPLTATAKTVEIMGDESQTIIPMDIKYNGHLKAFDILAFNVRFRDIPVNVTYPMQIYHVTQNVINNVAPLGDGTRYDDEYLIWSIDHVKSSMCYVASGDVSKKPVLFKYIQYLWKTCPERFQYSYYTGKIEVAKNVNTIPYRWINPESEEIVTQTGEVDLQFICDDKE